MSRRLPRVSQPRMAQPLPWMVVAAAVKWALEGVEVAEVFVDGGGEFAGGLVAAVGGEVGPEGGVVDVAAEVEGEGLLEADDGAVVAGVAGGGEFVEGLVEGADVGLVVLGVVQLHDLAGDVRGEGAVVVGQVGQAVRGHGGLPRSGSRAVQERSSRSCHDFATAAGVRSQLQVDCKYLQLVIVLAARRQRGRARPPRWPGPVRYRWFSAACGRRCAARRPGRPAVPGPRSGRRQRVRSSAAGRCSAARSSAGAGGSAPAGRA